eukprot:jgi/Chlat1/4248/Chrsp27S04318
MWATLSLCLLSLWSTTAAQARTMAIAMAFTTTTTALPINTFLSFGMKAPLRQNSHSSSSPHSSSNGSHLCQVKRRRRGSKLTMRVTSSSLADIGDNAKLAAEVMTGYRDEAKDRLLSAIRSYSGPEALGNLYTSSSEAGKPEVLEALLALEKMNPTTTPTNSTLLAGDWEFLWAGGSSPGLVAAQAVLRAPVQGLAKVEGIVLSLKTNIAVAKATLRLLSSLELDVTLNTTLLIESDVRLKEAYESGFISTLRVPPGESPQGVAALLSSSGLLGLGESIVGKGISIPLGLTGVQRTLYITYLDEELLIARDAQGLPDILARLPPLNTLESDPILEYDS